MSRRSLYWIVPLLYAAGMLLHGATIGLTDDEAYYWVLAQKPALGYAYHPPAVAWLIAGAQALLGWLFGTHSEGLVRLPGILGMALTLALGLRWVLDAGFEDRRLGRAAAVLLSFAGIFALSWMMVPDLPLFFGWTLVFVSVWRYCFQPARREGPASSALQLASMAAGMAVMMLSKYSGVLAAASAVLALGLWAPKGSRVKGTVAVSLGFALGMIPALVWNAQHEWSSILWQLRDRHGGGSFSLIRYGRFLAVEMLAAGPWIVGFAGMLFFRALKRRDVAVTPYRYLAVWMLPAAAVFCVQPLFSDFKPHWAFIVWWPAALGLAWAVATDRCAFARRWGSWQIGYGLALGALVLVSCHWPVGGLVMQGLGKSPLDPRLDVTNDLYGWSEFESFLRESLGEEALRYPIVGSWYQTASQAAFAIHSHRQVTLLPLDLKARDEWPDLGISKTLGPEWPSLEAKVLYVADNRYGDAPGFANADCAQVARFDKKRGGFAAKSILVWRCAPASGRP